MTALSGAVLGMRMAQAEGDFAAAAGRAAAAAIAQAGAASAGLTAQLSGLAAGHAAAVAGLMVGHVGTVAGAQAEEGKARQFADGTARIAKAQAGVTATGAVGAAAQTATSASAAASVALTAALTAAATAYVEAVAGAQRDLAKSLAAIGHAREVAGIDAAATHAHAVLSADVSRDTALAGVNLDFSQRRTALSLEITSAGADAVQAKMIQSAVEGTKASIEATKLAWEEHIATLHANRSAGYGFWELVSVGSASGYGGGPTHPGNGADGFGLRDWLSLGLGSIPGLGTAMAIIEFGTGMDYVAGRAVDQRLAGVGLLASLIPGSRILGKGAAAAARHGDEALDLAGTLRRWFVASGLAKSSPTVAELRALGPVKGFQVHHILPEYLGRMIGFTSEQMAGHPGMFISQWSHTGALNPDAIHKAISRYLPPMANGQRATYSATQIRIGLQQAYADLRMTDLFRSIEHLIP